MSTPSFHDAPRSVSLTTGTLLKVVLIALALAFLWFVRDILAILFVALLLAAIIDPFADWLAKRKLPRGLAVVLVYIILGGILLAVSLVLVPIVAEQLSQLATNLPTTPLLNSLGRFRDVVVQYGLEENLRSGLASIQTSIADTATSLFSTLRGIVGAVATLFIILVLTFYMVVEDEAARRSFRHIAPEQYQPYLTSLLLKMQKKVGAWLRGQLLLGLVIGVAVYVGLSLLGVRYALLLAVVAGTFELIPYIGPVISVIPAALIALGDSPFKALCVLVLFLVLQQTENHFLVPKIMQKATGLNPVVSIVALLVGVQVAGIAGAFLSIPVATMVSVLLDDLFSKPAL